MSTKGVVIQLVILVSAIGLLAFLVMAPKNYSVKKIKEEKTKESKSEITQQITEVKNDMKKEDLLVINGFEAQFEAAAANNKTQWMDSIIGFWDSKMRPAISAVYAKDKAEMTGKMEDFMIAGERFIGVGQFLKPEDKAWAYTEAREIFETTPENPMQGIALLREVVADDPNNTRAILQLGHFSVLSGQYSKALERYQQALDIDPSLVEAYFYLGDTYAKMGDMKSAEKYLLIYRGLLEDEEVKKQLDIYLEDLKKNVEH